MQDIVVQFDAAKSKNSLTKPSVDEISSFQDMVVVGTDPTLADSRVP